MPFEEIVCYRRNLDFFWHNFSLPPHSPQLFAAPIPQVAAATESLPLYHHMPRQLRIPSPPSFLRSVTLYLFAWERLGAIQESGSRGLTAGRDLKSGLRVPSRLKRCSTPADQTSVPKSFLDRYQAGDCAAVWEDLVALGSAARHELYLADAQAVARETMRRARRNVEMLIGKLEQLNYSFPDSYSEGHKELDRLTKLESTLLKAAETNFQYQRHRHGVFEAPQSGSE